MNHSGGKLVLLVVCLAPGLVRAASLNLNFTSAVGGTLADSSGVGTGFTTRLPGTGGALPANDPNMTLNTGAGTLTIMTTTNDLNGQIALDVGEYLGIQLSSLGFTGGEDFSVSATFLNSVFTEDFDQFGIVIGVASDINYRAGPLFAGGSVMYATSNVGTDAGAYFDGTFAPLQGDTITMELTRVAGAYSVSIANVTNPGLSGSLAIAFPPNFLNLADDMIVGVYASSGANTNPKAVTLDSFAVNVGTIGPPAHPGDFDGDGDVDGADFVIWQTNFPTAGGAAPDEGDADGDGDVDGADFVIWQTNFPFTPAPGVAPVPEPGSITLIAIATIVAMAAHRRKRR